MDINQYITPLKKMALGQLEEEIKTWKDKTGVEFQKLLKILENYHHSLQNQRTKSKNILEPWLLCLDYSKQIRNWTLNVKNIPGICIQLNFFENWRNELTTNLEKFPLTIKKNLEGIANQTGANETLKFKTWKWFIRRAIQLQSFITKTINWLRSLFKKEKRKRKIFYKKISLRLFLEFYYGIPIAELYLKESQIFLQNISNSIQEIHQMNESHKDSVLGLENFREHLTALKPEDLRKYEQDIQEISLKVKEFINQIIKSESNLVLEFEKNFQQIHQKISQKAELLGTPLLPKRSFGQRKIREDWNYFEKNITRFKSIWEKHYLGEQEDWQKDLDLATLQFELGIIVKKQLLVIEGKIKNKFTPEFSKVKNLLLETEQKFKSFSFDDSKELRSKLVEENSIVLKLLRQNVLPDLTDIIIGANIKQDFQEILVRSQAALEQIAEQHNIFKHRDFENLPPESKIENIPLKELLNEEYGNAFTNQHKALQEEVHEKLDSIFRDISEIDQIVEFNLEAAINLLTESETDQSSEAHQMVIDGLGRTQSHIDSLMVKSKDLSDFVEEKQTEVTLQLEEKIQKLADNEKIIELKFQIAKTKAKEELRARWRKTLITLRRILPIVISYSKKNLNDLYQKYTKFRRFTGLAPISIQIEDEIIQFLIETQKRIKSLPYVYQRLFRIEPLEDERFFSARKTEMSALEAQFEMWLSGQYANTALVGERGSGKTTLINFAKQKFYKNHTIYQFDFNKRIYNENELLEELKKLFKCSQVKDFLELENYIHQQNEPSVVVFENLQNLFVIIALAPKMSLIVAVLKMFSRITG